MKHLLDIVNIAALLLVGCNNNGPGVGSSVPSAPVQLRLNTATGIYVHFIPGNWGEYMTINEHGYHYRGQTMPPTAQDYWGYKGVVVYIDMNSRHVAFDMCCPHCVFARDTLRIDAPYAVCPSCGERYDMSDGYAWPTQGIGNEPLRKYNTIYSGDQLTISNHN